jgi:hypothetical protein
MDIVRNLNGPVIFDLQLFVRFLLKKEHEYIIINLMY